MLRTLQVLLTFCHWFEVWIRSDELAVGTPVLIHLEWYESHLSLVAVNRSDDLKQYSIQTYIVPKVYMSFYVIKLFCSLNVYMRRFVTFKFLQYFNLYTCD